MTGSVPAADFEARYVAEEDPWALASSPYEAAKYARTLAALPAGRIGRALELGCSIGVFTARLAPRCDELVALDGAATAVARARERLRGRPGVRIAVGTVPADLPPGPWDLVVASEVLYYLDAAALGATLDGIEAGLRPGGRVLAVDWRGATGAPLTGDDVHVALRARPGLRLVREETHDDYRLDLLERG